MCFFNDYDRILLIMEMRTIIDKNEIDVENDDDYAEEDEMDYDGIMLRMIRMTMMHKINFNVKDLQIR